MADDKNSPMKDLVKAESVIQLAIALPVGCFLGWLLGGWLDRKLHQEWIQYVGVLMGAVGGFIQIVRAAMGSMKK